MVGESLTWAIVWILVLFIEQKPEGERIGLKGMGV